MQSIFTNFIWIYLKHKSAIWTTVSQFKGDMVLWKRPKRPQYMQRTWWQRVATHHTGLRVLYPIVYVDVNIYVSCPNFNAGIIFINKRGYQDPFYSHRLTLIPTWISNHMPNKVWDEITYPFPNFNGCIMEVWEWVSNFIQQFIMDIIIYIHIG